VQKSYSWLINPRTGDYDIANGDPQRDESLQFPAYLRLRVTQGEWLYAPDDTYGSNFRNVRKRTTNVTRILTDVCTQALNPLLEDLRANDIVVESVSSGRNSEELEITIRENNGEVSSFVFEPVGS